MDTKWYMYKTSTVVTYFMWYFNNTLTQKWDVLDVTKQVGVLAQLHTKWTIPCLLYQYRGDNPSEYK